MTIPRDILVDHLSDSEKRVLRLAAENERLKDRIAALYAGYAMLAFTGILVWMAIK